MSKKLTLINLAQSKYIPGGTILTVGKFTAAKCTAPYYCSKHKFYSKPMFNLMCSECSMVSIIANNFRWQAKVREKNFAKLVYHAFNNILFHPYYKKTFLSSNQVKSSVVDQTLRNYQIFSNTLLSMAMGEKTVTLIYKH